MENDRFYARDVKVVKTHLTSETLKPSGIKTGRIKVDKLTDKNKIFLKKDKVLFSEDTGHEQTRHQINVNARIYAQINVGVIAASQIYVSTSPRMTNANILARKISLRISIFWMRN